MSSQAKGEPRRRGVPAWVRPLQPSLALVVLGIYLFVSAPPPLSTADAGGGVVPVADALRIVARENDAVRALYTERIVAAGKRVGLAFDEAWQRPEVEAGPLPALFLRMMAEALQHDGGQLGLFLGSAYPIASANRFSPQQLATFRKVASRREPEIVYAAELGQFVAMFPDVASTAGCVDCHNAHPRSPKRDWKLGDVMGATTWMYPEKQLTTDGVLRLVAGLRRAARVSYARFLDKARGFAAPPEIGERWPSEGRFLPDARTFMEALDRRAAPETLGRILRLEVRDDA